MRNII